MSEVKLGDNVVIQCPLMSFELRMVKHCLSCEHYNGLIKATVNSEPVEGNEADDFQVICTKPITRKLIKINRD